MIILASASPRRQELLQQIGCSFRCITSEATEEKRQDITPQELVMHNALLKAQSVAQQVAADLPVLGADTVVSFNGQIFGKPENAAEAKRMLGALSGNSHQVCTGIAFVRGTASWCEAVTTNVKFAELTAAEIDDYVATGEPADKAGAYGIQGRAAAFVEGIEGCYANVVGLPLQRVAKLAKEAGIDLR